MKAVASCGALSAMVMFGAMHAAHAAPPSVWDRVADERVADAYAVHVAVEQRLEQVAEIQDVPGAAGLERSLVDAVLGILERAGAEHSPDVRLRFDLGRVLGLRLDHRRAAEVLSAALESAPDHPAAEQAWSRLAAACGHIGDHACERRAYVGFLRLATEDVIRDTAILNLAETDMHLGHMREAVEGYREAYRLSTLLPTNLTTPLALWGLAVALDRSGDPAGAEREARRAKELERSLGRSNLLRSRDVYFYPSYEIHWYEGLGALAMARAAPPADAAALFGVAERSFGSYVAMAERAPADHPDRWIEIARRRLATVKTERVQAEKKTGPAREGPRGDVAL